MWTAWKRLLPGETLEWLVEPKIDGVAVSLRYENGHLKTGATRGDGERGRRHHRQPAHHAQRAAAVKGAPEILEVRGEVYMTEAGFRRVCDEMVAAGEEPFANARNATAGSLKQLDPSLVAKRPLEIVLYGLGEISDDEPADAGGAARVGCKSSDFAPAVSEACATRRKKSSPRLRNWIRIRDGFGFETDGAVIKLNSRRATRARGLHLAGAALGEGLQIRRPSRRKRKLREITVQVGRTGVLTPVAELEPVFLRGSTIAPRHAAQRR
ncbi:MAG: hypothetical protein QM796_17645 [Chthoniobacteraceae bacterium]